MQFGRTLLTFLVAASVAMLPVVGGIAVPAAAKSMDMSASIAMPASGDVFVSDCCPSDAVPCDKATGNCADMAACAFSNFSFSSGAVAALVFPIVGTQILPPLAHQPLRSQTSSPPFRPPRV